MSFAPYFFNSGLRCLDFGNSVDYLQSPPRYDILPDRAAIIEWGRCAGILPPDMLADPVPGDISFARVIETRDLFSRMFLAFASGEDPAAPDLVLFNVRLQETAAQMQIIPANGGYVLACRSSKPLERVACEVVRLAADFLLTGDLGRIRRCGECGWLFYDKSRNASRRWCEMKSCGNRAKARRHYQRVKNQKTLQG